MYPPEKRSFHRETVPQTHNTQVEQERKTSSSLIIKLKQKQKKGSSKQQKFKTNIAHFSGNILLLYFFCIFCFIIFLIVFRNRKCANLKNLHMHFIICPSNINTSIYNCLLCATWFSFIHWLDIYSMKYQDMVCVCKKKGNIK